MLSWLSGIKVYAYIALGVVVLSLLGSVAFLWELHQRDLAEAKAAKQNLDFVSGALKESEADKAVLAQKARELDDAIQERDKRLKALNEAKRKLADELDRIKKTVPAEDQACLDRPLPSGILDLLRGSTGGDQDSPSNDSGKPAPAVPEV